MDRECNINTMERFPGIPHLHAFKRSPFKNALAQIHERITNDLRILTKPMRGL